MTTVVGLVFAITCLAAEGDRTAIQAVRKHWFDLRASETTGATLVFDHSEVVDSGRTRTEYSIVWGPRKGNFSAIAKGEAYRSHLAITAVKASWRYSDNTVVDHVFECSLKAPLNDAERWALDRGFLIHDWKSAERSSFAQLEAVLASAKSSETLMPGNYAFHATKAGEILVRCSPKTIEVVRRGNTERLICRYAVGSADAEGVARRASKLFQASKNDHGTAIVHRVGEAEFDLIRLTEAHLSPFATLRKVSVAEARDFARRLNLLFPTDAAHVVKAEAGGRQLNLWIKDGEREVVLTQLHTDAAEPNELRRLAEVNRRVGAFEVLYVPPLGTKVGLTYYVKGPLWAWTLGDRFADPRFENLMCSLEHPK